MYSVVRLVTEATCPHQHSPLCFLLQSWFGRIQHWASRCPFKLHIEFNILIIPLVSLSVAVMNQTPVTGWLSNPLTLPCVELCGGMMDGRLASISASLDRNRIYIYTGQSYSCLGPGQLSPSSHQILTRYYSTMASQPALRVHYSLLYNQCSCVKCSSW